MKIFKLFFIYLASFSFGEETHNEAKLVTDRDKLSRCKKALIQPKDRHHDIINQDVNNIISPKTVRHDRSKINEHVVNAGRYAKGIKVPAHKFIPSAYQPPIHHANVPVVINPNLVKVHKNDKPHHQVNSKPALGFFIERDDNHKKIEKRPIVSPIPIAHHPSKIEAWPKSPNENCIEDKHQEHNTIHTTTTTAPETIKIEKALPELHAKDCKTKEELLETAVKNASEHKEDKYELENAIKQLPELVNTLINSEKKLAADIVSKNVTNCNQTQPILNSTIANVTKNDDVKKLLLKPIIESKYNKNLKEKLKDIRNGTIDSIQIIHQNYTEVTEKILTPEKICVTENVDICEKEPKENVVTNHPTATTIDNFFRDCLGSELIKPAGIYYESPMVNVLHDIRDGYSPSNVYTDNYSNSPYAVHSIPPPDIMYNETPYRNPTQDNNINTYKFRINDNGNFKSKSIEENGKNITWRIWTNTEVLIKAKNDHADAETESKARFITPHKPVYTSDFKFNNCYQKPMHSNYVPYLNDPSAMYNNYHQNQFRPYYQAETMPSYINYYNNQNMPRFPTF